jgi:acetylornithine/succinyldiaminopimelate/putrescine aminotransferase
MTCLVNMRNLLLNILALIRLLPMNTGAEAVETALKIARKWAYEVKGIDENKAEIIVCENNFHGRTTTIISFLTILLHVKILALYQRFYKN